jgi:hypothetical protein
MWSPPRDIEKLAIVGDAPNHDVDVGGRLWWAAIQSSPVSRSCSICRMRSRVKPRRSPIPAPSSGAMMNRRLKLPPLWKQTWFPILVMFLIALYFAFLMIHTGRAIGSNEDFSNLLVLGLEWQRNAFEDGPEAYRIGTFVAISFAYLGWYVWSIATIFTRHATLELVAATHTNMLIRLVMAVLLAAVFRHLASSLFTSAGILSTVATGFGVGIFLGAALIWISRELRRRLLGQTDADNDAPLDLIQGISPYRMKWGWTRARTLRQVILLFISSNLSLLEVLDWMSPSAARNPGRPGEFRKAAVKRVATFERACGGDAKPVVSALIGYDERQLDDLRKRLQNDANFKRVEALQQRISIVDEKDGGSAIAGALVPLLNGVAALGRFAASRP